MLNKGILVGCVDLGYIVDATISSCFTAKKVSSLEEYRSHLQYSDNENLIQFEDIEAAIEEDKLYKIMLEDRHKYMLCRVDELQNNMYKISDLINAHHSYYILFPYVN